MTNAVDERGVAEIPGSADGVRFEHRGGLAGFENLKGKHHDEFERR